MNHIEARCRMDAAVSEVIIVSRYDFSPIAHPAMNLSNAGLLSSRPFATSSVKYKSKY